MSFFIDNCLGPKIAAALAAMGHDVRHLRDTFSPDTKDADWLPFCGEHRLVVVTVDHAIMTVGSHERKTLEAHNVSAYFLAKGWLNMKLHEQAGKIITWWPTLEAHVVTTSPGQCFRVKQNGKILPY